MKFKIFILLFSFLIILLAFSYVEIKKNHMEKMVEKYLIEDKGYNNHEIHLIEGFFSKLPLWGVRVVFENEKNMNYYYQIESNKVEQVRYYPANSANEEYINDFIKDKLTPKHRE